MIVIVNRSEMFSESTDNRGTDSDLNIYRIPSRSTRLSVGPIIVSQLTYERNFSPRQHSDRTDFSVLQIGLRTDFRSFIADVVTRLNPFTSKLFATLTPIY